MWKLFFTTCDFLCRFVPGRARRNHLRRVVLYDYHRKYMALRAAYPDMNFRRMRVVKGGWNIGFIVDKKYVFKIRKFYDKNTPDEKIMREKRITDAVAAVSPLRIPRIEIVRAGEYTFFKYDYIPGRNLNTFRARTIVEHGWQWGRQLAEFISAVHGADLPQLADLKTTDGDGWNHNDICNNIIVDTKTMRIVGLIDWEYAGWGKLDTEFENTVIYSKKIESSGLGVAMMLEYYSMNDNDKKIDNR